MIHFASKKDSIMKNKFKWVAEKKTITIRMSSKLFKELDRISVKKQVSLNKIINILLEQAIDNLSK